MTLHFTEQEFKIREKKEQKTYWLETEQIKADNIFKQY